MTKHLFVSYSARDHLFAEKLASDLEGIGIAAWLDRWEIKVGDAITQKVDDGIAGMSLFAVVLSHHSVRSEWVQRELTMALRGRLDQEAVVMLPILLETCEVPPALGDLKYADFRQDYEEGLCELLGSVGDVVRGSDALTEVRSELQKRLESNAAVLEHVLERAKEVEDQPNLRPLHAQFMRLTRVRKHMCRVLGLDPEGDRFLSVDPFQGPGESCGRCTVSEDELT